MKKVWPILLALAVGCNENPYPNGGGDVTKEAPKPVRAVQPAVSVDFSERVFNFTEGTEDFYRLNAKVPTGRPVITLQGLPTGAVYENRRILIDEHPSDPSQNVYEYREGLYWNPDTKTVDTELNPELRERIFDVDVFVASSNDTSIKSSFKIFLKVSNTRQSTKLTMGSNWDDLDVKEGGRDELKLKIESKEFPTGDFDLTISPKIQGLRYEPIQNAPGEYNVIFEPNFDAIHVKDCGGSSFCKKTFDVSFRVIEPDNNTTNIVKKVSFSDSRQKVAVSMEDKITIGLNGSFEFLSSDPNNEVEPRVELSGLEPEFGKFKVETKSFTATNKSTLTRVEWTDIPQSFIGESEFFSFRVCNYGYTDFSNVNSPRDPSNCTTKTIEVEVVQNERPAPKVKRDKWINNERKYLLVGESITEVIEFEVPADEDSPKIELIKPMALGDGQGDDQVLDNEITIFQSGSNIRMIIEAKRPGPAQFSIRLTSSYGVQHVEGFFFEVLPADWSSVLVLGESRRSQEQKNLEANIENFDFINPFNTALKFPQTLKRDTIVVGTDILRDLPDDAFFNNIFQNFKNVIIASPLVVNLSDAVLNRFKDQNVEPNGRLSSRNFTGNISDLSLIADKDVLTANQKAASLKGDSSLESADPAVIKVSRNSACKAALFLEAEIDTNIQELPLAVVCNRGNGGKMILMGTEWGEFQMEATEIKLPQTWFNELMNVEFE